MLYGFQPFRARTAPLSAIRPLAPHFFWLCVAFSLCLAGCNETAEEIRTYTVAKPAPILPPASDAASASHATAELKPTEILGAIMPRGETTWFFKFMGPPAAVDQVKTDFALFLQSVQIEKKGPTWKLPEGWEATPGNDIRFATIQVQTSAGPLEMTVIPLPSGDGGIESLVLANVNRWRDQVGLEAITAAQLAETKEIASFTLNKEPVWVTDFIGQSRGNPMAPMNRPGGDRPSASAGARESKPADRKPLPFDCVVPASWKRGSAGELQLALFHVVAGEKKGTVTVSVAGGDMVANVNRWREQVKLPLAKADDLAREAQPIVVDGNEGALINLVSPESAAQRKAIIGVIVAAQGQQWFFKFIGDAELAPSVKPELEDFVKSIKFR